MIYFALKICDIQVVQPSWLAEDVNFLLPSWRKSFPYCGCTRQVERLKALSTSLQVYYILKPAPQQSKQVLRCQQELS